MCQFCDGYWECDGEGGEGQCLAREVRCEDHGSQPPDPPGWSRRLHEILKYRDGLDVLGQNEQPIRFEMHGSVDQQSHELTVTVNGWEVEHENDHKPPPAPHPDRDRTWHINYEFTLRAKGTGEPVQDKDGDEVRVRVQAYPYEYKDDWHKDTHCPDAKDGWGPKMRIWAVKRP